MSDSRAVFAGLVRMFCDHIASDKADFATLTALRVAIFNVAADFVGHATAAVLHSARVALRDHVMRDYQAEVKRRTIGRACPSAEALITSDALALHDVLDALLRCAIAQRFSEGKPIQGELYVAKRLSNVIAEARRACSQRGSVSSELSPGPAWQGVYA